MNVGDAKIVISAEDKASAKLNGVGKSLTDLKGIAKKVGMAMAAAAAAVTAAVGKMLKDWASAGDQIAKMAKVTGVSIGTLSELKHVADLSGSSIEGLGDGIIKMQRRIEKAGQGLKTYSDALEVIGLSYDELKDLTPEEQFLRIANAIADTNRQQSKLLAATELFGVNTGAKLLPMLTAGSKAFREQRQEAHDLGLTFTDETGKGAENLTDAMLRLKSVVKGIEYTLANELGPVLTDLIENKIVPAIKDLRMFIKENEDLKELLTDLVDVAFRFADGLGAIAKMFKRIDDAFPDWMPSLLDFLTGAAAEKAGEQWRALFGGGLPGLKPGVEEKYGEEARGMNFLSGGIVPGPFGSPVPILAHGGEVVSGLHGEAMGGTTVNISMGNYLGDEASLREFVREVKDIFNQDVRRTSFPGVNTLKYFQGSSAP